MSKDDRTFRIFLSAAEPSADAHCADLINALKQEGKFSFAGLGGEKMEAAGCELIARTTDKAAMAHKAFAQVGRFFLILKKVKSYFAKNKVDLVIVCDSPAFNFHVAKAAKKFGIKTMFYVAPQLWAWAPWRIKKLKRSSDKLCCILPFEEKWFTSRGIDAQFVGNPLLDSTQAKIAEPKTYEDFEKNEVRIALMPGSRSAELDSLWPAMQKLALKIKAKYPQAKFTTVAADARRKEQLKSYHLIGFKCDYSICDVNRTAARSDLSIIASGSATLQVAAAGCPMVVIYQSSKALWHLVGRWLINTKHLSLVNILAKKELVPEFMPYFDSLEPIFEAVVGQIENPDKMRTLSKELVELAKQLQNPEGVSRKTAEIVCGMLGAAGQQPAE